MQSKRCVLSSDDVGAGKVGDRERHSADAVGAAPGQASRTQRRLDHGRGGRMQRRHRAQGLPPQRRVHDDAAFACATLTNIVVISLRQTLVPDALLGRVNSFYRVALATAAPLGALVAGQLADLIGLRVPLLVKLPGRARAGETVETPAQLADLLPTVTRLLGLTAPADVAGEPLLDAAAGERRIYSETLYPRLALGWSELRSLVEGRWHFIRGVRDELYDRERDPGEMRDVAGMLDGRHATIPLLVVTSPQVKPDADRLGVTARIEAAGGLVLSGMCFYQSYAREMAEANGWQALATNSAKLVNILGGYGYRPALLSMQACVDAACAGRITA